MLNWVKFLLDIGNLFSMILSLIRTLKTKISENLSDKNVNIRNSWDLINIIEDFVVISF